MSDALPPSPRRTAVPRCQASYGWPDELQVQVLRKHPLLDPRPEEAGRWRVEMCGVLQMTDWQRICSVLRRTFGTLRKVSRTLHHRNPDYLTKLERGEISDPRYSLGEGLIELYPFAPKSLGQAICREATFRQRRRACPGMKGADRAAVISAVADPRRTV